MTPDLRIMALVAAHNEADVIGATLDDLFRQGIEVRLLDDACTDETVAVARSAAARGGSLEIDHMTAPEDGRRRWSDILEWKNRCANESDADWLISQDADELRESPWLGQSLRTAIELVDRAGFNAIDYKVLDFWPTELTTDGHETAESRYRSASDLRDAFDHFEYSPEFNELQVKTWRRPSVGNIDLVSSGGHEALFRDRKVFPLQFLLRHYPVRSVPHGERKIKQERIARLSLEEQEQGWHVQYRAWTEWQRDSKELERFDPESVRMRLLLAACEQGSQTMGSDSQLRLIAKLESDLHGRNLELEQKHDQNRMQGEELKQLHSALDAAHRAVEDARAELGIRDLEIARLHQELDEAQQGRLAIEEETSTMRLAEIRLREVLDSRSWRWTRFLRRGDGS